MCQDPALKLLWPNSSRIASFGNHGVAGWPGTAEPWLTVLLAGLFREKLVPPGSIVDAGANTGELSCLLARWAPDRTVHAVDPSPTNINLMESEYGAAGARLLNLRPRLGALSSKASWLQMPVRSNALCGQQIKLEGASVHGAGGPTSKAIARNAERQHSVRITTLDKWFAQDTIGLVHLDVEGSELAVVQGGATTFRRDLPIIFTELHVHNNATYSRALLRSLSDLGYASYLVDELSSYFNDGRNLLHLPRSLTASPGSLTVTAMIDGGYLHAVEDATISDYAHPCCGGSPRNCCSDSSHASSNRAIGPKLQRKLSMRCCLCCMRQQTHAAGQASTTCPPAAARRRFVKWLGAREGELVHLGRTVNQCLAKCEPQGR